MLDRDLIRRQPEDVRHGIERKSLDATIVDRFLAADRDFRAARTQLNELEAEMNRISKSIGQLMSQGKKEEAEAAKAETRVMKDRLSVLSCQERDLDQALLAIELDFPNLPNSTVPDGKDDNDNVVVRTWGEPPEGQITPHWDIAEELELLDLPRAAKIAGSGFVVYTGMGARLQRALFNYMVDVQTLQHQYREIYPPYLVNRSSLIGTGNLPKFEDDLYKAEEDLYLIPTAEVPITNLFRDEILDADQLPMRLAGYSACFRKEAGAAGKDTRGLLRIHQFDKVEMVKFVKPEDSYAELESMTRDAESILQALGLHYRVIELCAGDLGAKGCKCYDLEVWAPGVGKYLEISSCTNFEAYQARRANIRYRPEKGSKPEFVHILNGSGLACPRLFAALVETYREEGGAVRIPEPLQPYVGVERLKV